MTVCDFTNLPADQCAHCRGLDSAPEPIRVDGTSTARYHGRCPICDQTINPGDTINHTDLDGGTWVCEVCP